MGKFGDLISVNATLKACQLTMEVQTFFHFASYTCILLTSQNLGLETYTTMQIFNIKKCKDPLEYSTYKKEVKNMQDKV